VLDHLFKAGIRGVPMLTDVEMKATRWGIELF
jgi:hypothetical protein